jgi:hypothetical protein
MRSGALVFFVCLSTATHADELESRVLTHYVPQDFLETVVRTENWTELKIDVKGGLRKGDIVRVWAGGTIDWGNGDQPGENISTPAGLASLPRKLELERLVLSNERSNAFALLFKSEAKDPKKCLPAGKPLEIPISKDKEKVWLGFNDLRGHYNDNHLGKGRRHELDPLWIRIEVVRIIVD